MTRSHTDVLHHFLLLHRHSPLWMDFKISVPILMTSGQGTSFTSQFWVSLEQLLGTFIHHTTAYNSEVNAMVGFPHNSWEFQGLGNTFFANIFYGNRWISMAF